MQTALSDTEVDALRHLAIRRDVLQIGCAGPAATVLIADTALSVTLLDYFGGGASATSEALAAIRRWDRDGKIAVVASRWEAMLPLIDLEYLDLVVYTAGAELADVGEALSQFGRARADATIAVHAYEGEAAQRIARWADAKRRPLRIVDRLAVMGAVKGDGRKGKVWEV